MGDSKSTVNVIKSVVDILDRETLIAIVKKLIEDSTIVEYYMTNVFLDAGLIRKNGSIEVNKIHNNMEA